MKNAEQFSSDMTANEALRVKFREGLNKFRSDETVSMAEASKRVAADLGYEVSEEDVKKFMARMQAANGKLSDSELDKVAGGNESKPTCFTW